MGMTDRQKQTVQRALQGKIAGPCPMCRQANWQIAEDFVQTPTMAIGGGVALGGPVIPMVQVICTNCGFVAHYAAGVIGIKLE